METYVNKCFAKGQQNYFENNQLLSTEVSKAGHKLDRAPM